MTDVQYPSSHHHHHNMGVNTGLASGVGAPVGTTTTSTVTQQNVGTSGMEARELAAYEKGRMQGEMEAARRLESETQLKQYPAEMGVGAVGMSNIARPDVVEINRLTWMQRINALVAELSGLTYIILTIAWIKEYRGDFGWSNNGGDAAGDVKLWNTQFITFALGLFCHTQALLMYRILPIRMNPWLNRAIYTFWYTCAIVCYLLTVFCMVKSAPSGEGDFWAIEQWCFAFALAVTGLHYLYSNLWAWITRFPTRYEDWAETNNGVTNYAHATPEQRRDASIANDGLRTIYAPQPGFIRRHLFGFGWKRRAAANAAGATTGVNPSVNAPRWAENPNTHAEDFFLVPRKKWAVCGFFAMGAVFLMDLTMAQHNFAAGQIAWSQGGADPTGPTNEDGNHSALIGGLGIVLLASILSTAYAAMPPRTTLVKNGILVDPARRSSISHNAETRVGNPNNIV